MQKFWPCKLNFFLEFLTCRLFVNLVVIRCGLAWTGCIFIGCPDDQLDQLDQLVLVLRGICFREIVWNDVIAGRNLGRVDDDTAKTSNIQNCQIIISKQFKLIFMVFGDELRLTKWTCRLIAAWSRSTQTAAAHWCTRTAVTTTIIYWRPYIFIQG